MEQQDFDRLIREKEGALSLAFPALMRKVYVWMTLALIITGVTAYGVAHSEVLMSQMFESRAVFMVLIIAELALVFGISRFINRLSLTTATLLFILYSALNGATLSVIRPVSSPRRSSSPQELSARWPCLATSPRPTCRVWARYC